MQCKEPAKVKLPTTCTQVIKQQHVQLSSYLLYLASFVHRYVSVRFAHIDSLAIAYSSWLQNSSY